MQLCLTTSDFLTSTPSEIGTFVCVTISKICTCLEVGELAVIYVILKSSVACNESAGVSIFT